MDIVEVARAAMESVFELAKEETLSARNKRLRVIYDIADYAIDLIKTQESDTDESDKINKIIEYKIKYME